jgi:hypothetical protein
MKKETFDEGITVTKPGGTGQPTELSHDIYLTRQGGVVQGWTTSHGKPVAVVNDRTTYNHDIDSVAGFLRWGEPKLTHSPQSWFKGAEQIAYTFNWFYADSRHVAYYVSGKDPVRPKDVDPALPTWGDGGDGWRGTLPAKDHVHEIDPKHGFFVSWNNKPAPGFSAADDQFGYGPVYRSQLLVKQLEKQLHATHHRVTRADVVTAMSTASTQDLDGVTVLPQLLRYLKGRHEPAKVKQMLAQLRSWYADGSHRIEKSYQDPTAGGQYLHASAIAIMDELYPNLIEAVWNHLLAKPGISGQGSTGGASVPGYSILPLQFANTPNSGDAHLGSAYDGGWEGNMVKTFQELRGGDPAAPFTAPITGQWCNGKGMKGCGAAIDGALLKTFASLKKANGSAKVGHWTKTTALVDDPAGAATMPAYDAIGFRAIGIVGQPDIQWQNRPTFQQVVEFPRHRPGKGYPHGR